MARRVSVTASVRVKAAPAVAFRRLIDAEGQHDWMLGTTVHPVAGDVESPAVGSRLVAFTGVASLGVLDTMVVTEYEPDSRWVVTHEGTVIHGDGVFAVEPSGAGSLVSWTEDLELPFGVLGRIGWVVVRPGVKWGLQRSMKKFGALVDR